MPVVYPDRRSYLRELLIVLALLIAASGSYYLWLSNSAPIEGVKHADTAPPVPATLPPVALAKAPTSTSAATPVPPPASPIKGARSAPPQWQASLEPSVVSATRVDSLSAFQVQMEKWSCEGNRCVGDLRVPLSADAGRKHDLAASADILSVLQKKLGESDIQVAVRSIQPDDQGVAVSLEFSPDASRQGRFYTNQEIASIRAESVMQGSKMACKNSAH